MILAADAREATAKRKTGKGQWSFGVLNEWIRDGRSIYLLLNDDSVLPNEWKKDTVHELRLGRGFLWHIRCAHFLLTHKLLAYVSPTSFIVPYLVGSKVKVIQVIHDMIAFQDEKHDKKAKLIERFFLKHIVKTARLAAISESTKNDLIKKFPTLRPENICVSYAGPKSENPKRNTSDNRTILCPATLCPRKNQLRLIHAYSRLPSHLKASYELVLIGSRGWDDEDILDAVRKTDGVTWLNYVSDEEYESRISSCAVLAYPSLYEGFGLPVLDALQRGAAVLTSSGGSLSEVAGKAAYCIDPTDESAIAQGLEHILTDSVLYESLRKKGPAQAKNFSWKNAASVILNQA